MTEVEPFETEEPTMLERIEARAQSLSRDELLRVMASDGETAQIVSPVESAHWFVNYPEALLVEPLEGEDDGVRLQELEQIAKDTIDWNDRLEDAS